MNLFKIAIQTSPKFSLSRCMIIAFLVTTWSMQGLTAGAPLPGPMGKVSPANSTSDHPLNVSLSWGKSENADSFEVCIDTVSNSVCDTSWVDVGAVLSTSPPGLLPDTGYYWQVRAKNDGGVVEADADTWWRFATEVIPLPGPMSKDSPANSTDEHPVNVLLSWGKSEGADSFEVCIDTVSNGICDTSWVDVADVQSTSPPGLLPDTGYYWQVRAKNVAGTVEADSGDWWRFATAATPEDFSKSAPSDTDTGVSVGTDISWNKSGGATSYAWCKDVSNDDNCSGNWNDVGNNGSASLAGLLAPGTKYYWQARSSNVNGDTEADTGDWWEFTTSDVPNDFAKNLPAQSSTDVSPSTSLDWGISFATDSYEYCVDKIDNDDCDGGWVDVGTNSASGALSLDIDTEYYWQVRALHEGEITESDAGVWWRFKTAAAPGDFGKDDPAHNTPDVPFNTQLSWEKSSGADEYEYCIDNIAGIECDTIWKSTPDGITDPLALLPDITYYWQVRAINGAGTTESNNGTWWSFTTVPQQVFEDSFEDPPP